MVKAKPISKLSVYLSLVVLCSTLLLSGCLGPKTPQEVAKAFWQAVIDDDAHAAVKYSTLNTPSEFDRFGLDWHGFKPSWGKIIIDGDKARIVTTFSGPSSTETANRQCVTYLVHSNDVWKVDYKMTGDDLHGGALGALIGKLNQLGSELSKNLDASMQELNLEMERLSRKLKDMTDSLSQQANKIIEKSAEDLQRIMKELEQSINRALQDKHNHPSDRDRQVMQEVAADLDASSRKLSNPSTESIAESNYNMTMAEQRVDAIDNGIADDYKQHWQALARQFEQVMHKMMDELTMLEKSNTDQH